MADYRVSGPAEAAIVQILGDSERNFGALARRRYAALIVTAIGDIAADPGRPGVMRVKVREHAIGVYHIRYSRKRAPDPPGRVSEPRHLIVFREGQDGIIEILGIMHDRMAPARALRRILRKTAIEG